MAVLQVEENERRRPADVMHPRAFIGFGMVGFPARFLIPVAIIATLSSPIGTAQAQAPPDSPGAEPFVAEANAARSNRMVVREFRFHGNTAVPTEDLSGVVSGFVGRPVSSADLEKARQLLTERYITNGYFSSGALLPDQKITNGVVVFHIVEGSLAEVRVHGNRNLRGSYVERRIRWWAGHPVHGAHLEAALLELNGSPSIETIGADIQPRTVDGEKMPGESVLNVKITEPPPFNLEFSINNQRPPSVGAEQLEMLASYRNLAGYNDVLELTYGILHRSDDGVDFSGIDNLSAGYSIPFTRYDTKLQLRYRRDDFPIVEEPFTALDIRSVSENFEVTFLQPAIWTPKDELTFGVTGERGRTESTLEGTPFSFSPGAVDGVSTETVVRGTAEWIHRSATDVLTTHLSANWGVDALNATQNAIGRDGLFFSLRGQAQYVRRLWKDSPVPVNLHLRSTFQWAFDPLLSMEQYPIGGAYSVRGYRENQLIRDSAVTASAEVRVPVWRGRNGIDIVQLAPFVDFGAGWNEDNLPDSPSSLSSAGVGLVLQPHPRVQGWVYWGYPFRNVATSGDDDLQDLGLHFQLQVRAF